MRKQSGSPPDEGRITPQQPVGVITQVREYKLITPLFGGGVTPGEADPVTIIRGTEIRGQLRFWWRACRAGQYKTLEELKQAEDKIWGAASKKQTENKSVEDNGQKEEETPLQTAAVQIAVDMISQGTAVEPFTWERKKGKPVPKPDYQVSHPYAAFPLQPDIKKNEPLKKVQKDVLFTLTISFPESKHADIEAALWAWETFGGIGARTRRGFGAVCLLKIDNVNYTDLPVSNNVASWMKEKLTQHVAEGRSQEGIPHISRGLQFKVTKPSENPFEAWNNLIKRLSGFRQFPQGRDKRSKWPEAEAIREITGDRDSKYPKLSHPKKFPRAAFGLPIVFHFKDDDIDDPDDTTLQRAEEGKERLASPLILRPLACRDGKAVGLALLLEGTQTLARDLQLVDKNKKPYPDTIDTKLIQNEAKNIPALNGETDVLQAFMKYL